MEVETADLPRYGYDPSLYLTQAARQSAKLVKKTGHNCQR